MRAGKHSLGKISSGVWICLALGVFGGGMVAVFFRAARQFTSPSAAARATFNVPGKSLRLSSVNLHRAVRLTDQAAALIAAGDPDYVFLQEVHGKQLADIQRQLGGKLSASTYYPLQNLPEGDTDLGNAILSKYPLEDGRPIPNHMNGACGVWAVSVVDGRRFYVACLRLSNAEEGTRELENFVKAWESQGRPPIWAAVDGKWSRAEGVSRLDGEGKWLASDHWMGTDVKDRDGVAEIEARGRTRPTTTNK